jgi:hypothetical protein
MTFADEALKQRSATDSVLFWRLLSSLTLDYSRQDRSLLHVISLSPGWAWEALTMVRNIPHQGSGKAGGAWVFNAAYWREHY